MGLFKLTCDEATAICDKTQYGESSLWEKIKLNIHFLRCDICKVYTKQNTFMSVLINGNKEQLCKQQRKCLSEEEKELFKKELENLSK